MREFRDVSRASRRRDPLHRRSRLAAAAGVAGALALVPAVLGSSAGAATSSPNDPLFPQQWNLARVGAPAAWSRTTGQGVLVGVVDTGVDAQQEDLTGKVVASTDCIGSNGNPADCTGSGADDNGHGTHVAGIATALTDNGRGVAGMAPGARLVVAKALDNSGSGSFADVNAGIEWVVNHGARVVNLSLGSDLPALSGLLGGNSLTAGVEYAWQHGAVAVVAAGNENFFGLGSANYGDVDAVIVGATGPRNEIASYSSPIGNARWALVAPGGDGQDSSGNPSCAGAAAASCIVSTWWTAQQPVSSYAYDQGTSMATPMVSGALALLLGEGLSPSAAVQRLLATADHAVSCGQNCSGLLDVAKAVGVSGPAANGSVTTGRGGGAPASGGSGSNSSGPTGRGTGGPSGGGGQPSSAPGLLPSSGGTLPAQPAPAVPGVPAGRAPVATGTGPTPSPGGIVPAGSLSAMAGTTGGRRGAHGSTVAAVGGAAALLLLLAGAGAYVAWLRRMTGRLRAR